MQTGLFGERKLFHSIPRRWGETLGSGFRKFSKLIHFSLSRLQKN
tara:strand:- start:644 stop:778 length:135 start_codon:yes stop_codon:yes gene_type:complete